MKFCRLTPWTWPQDAFSRSPALHNRERTHFCVTKSVVTSVSIALGSQYIHTHVNVMTLVATMRLRNVINGEILFRGHSPGRRGSAVRTAAWEASAPFEQGGGSRRPREGLAVRGLQGAWGQWSQGHGSQAAGAQGCGDCGHFV